MKYFVIIIIILGVVGGGAAFWYNREKAAVASATNIYQTQEVERITVEKTITANGKVASNRDVDIKCQASGKVIKLPYDISDKVKVGDLLMELNPDDQKRSFDQAKAQVDASEARLAQAKTNLQVAQMNLTTTTARTQADAASANAKAADAKAKYKRTLELFKSQLASKEEVETAQTTAMQADAAVQSANAALAELDQQKISLETRQQDIATANAQLTQDIAKRDLQQSQLGYTKVYVPEDDASKEADFRVAALTVQLGTIVQSGSSGFSGGTTVMTLSDVSHMYVLASVDESDIGFVSDPARGGSRQKAWITVDAYPNNRFEGEVVRVATKGVNTSNVVTFEVKIEVTDEKRTLLRPEMTATARIIVASRPGVLAIPVGAFSRAMPADRAVATSDPVQTSPGTTDPSVTTDPAATTAPTSRRGGGGRGRGGRRGGGAGALALGTPMDGTVQILGADGKPELRNVTVGLTDDTLYEVIQGLEEGEAVVVNRGGGDSRWRNQNTNLIPRMGGGGGRGR